MVPAAFCGKLLQVDTDARWPAGCRHTMVTGIDQPAAFHTNRVITDAIVDVAPGMGESGQEI